MRGNKSRTSVLLFVLVVIASSAVLFYLSHSRSQATPTIKQDGSGVYNLGRTLPIKFQLTDTNNIFVANATGLPVNPGSFATATAKLFIAKIQDSIAGTDAIPLSTSAADSGNTFRYDSVDNQYIYNLSTIGLSGGTWQLRVVLDDGKSYMVLVSFRN
jgi:hypothetical protein